MVVVVGGGGGAGRVGEVLVGTGDQRDDRLVTGTRLQLADPVRLTAGVDVAVEELDVVPVDGAVQVLRAVDDRGDDLGARRPRGEQRNEIVQPTTVDGTAQDIAVRRLHEVGVVSLALRARPVVLVRADQERLEPLERHPTRDLAHPVVQASRIRATIQELRVHPRDHVAAVLVAVDQRPRHRVTRHTRVEHPRPIARTRRVGRPAQEVLVNRLHVRRVRRQPLRLPTRRIPHHTRRQRRPHDNHHHGKQRCPAAAPRNRSDDPHPALPCPEREEGTPERDSIPSHDTHEPHDGRPREIAIVKRPTFSHAE